MKMVFLFLKFFSTSTILSLIICSELKGQILSVNELFQKVKSFHPLAVQARLQPDFANAEWLRSKGGFDPELVGSLNQKSFENKEYFSLLNSELKIPTWIGADLKAGYDFNRGSFLGPENATPSNGLLYAGIAVPLGQGLLIDERRATFLQARINRNLATSKQTDLLNDLLFQAAIIYWDWFKSYNIRKIFRTSLINAQERYVAVSFNAQSGERPFIDTIEAKIQLQNIKLGLNQAELEYSNVSNLISGLIWDKYENNVKIPEKSTPALLEEEIVKTIKELPDSTISQFIANHPYLEQLRQKQNLLDVERRLKQDKLKPKVTLRYNALLEPIGSNFLTNYNINNYKWGIEFKMPLFIRKERADIKTAFLKIKENDLNLDIKTTELYNKYLNYINEWQASLAQIDLYKENVNLYEQMLNAERKLFNLGESSLFLINAREQSYINSLVKLTEIVAKNRIAYFSIFYFAGQMEKIKL